MWRNQIFTTIQMNKVFSSFCHYQDVEKLFFKNPKKSLPIRLKRCYG